MTKALPITQRQAQTLLRAAEAEHAIIEVKIGDKVIRSIPACRTQDLGRIDENADPETFDTLAEYRSWRDRSRAGGD